jgi:hypothetical protein
MKVALEEKTLIPVHSFYRSAMDSTLCAVSQSMCALGNKSLFDTYILQGEDFTFLGSYNVNHAERDHHIIKSVYFLQSSASTHVLLVLLDNPCAVLLVQVQVYNFIYIYI